MTRKSKNLLKASFIGTFAEFCILPIFAVLTARVGGSVIDAGIGYAIFCIVTGVIVATVGRTEFYQQHINKMLVGGFAVCGIGEFSYIFVGNTWQLFIVQTVVGLAAGILAPAWDSMYTEGDDSTSAVHKWSFWTGGVSFVTGTAAIFGACVAKYFGFPTLFIIMGLVDAFSVYYAWQATKEN